METVKGYRIQVEAPKDLIDAYFEVKKKALATMLKHVRVSSKAHLDFTAKDRRKLRDEFLKEWKFSKHYVDSAINSVIGLIKGWITLYNKGRVKNFPSITRKTIYIKNTLFSYRNGILKISIEPYKRYLELNLTRYSWIPKDFDKIGGLILTEKELTLTVKKNVEPRAEKWSSFDVNLLNVTALINDKVERYSLKEPYHIHRAYEIKRGRIQKLSKIKPNTSKILLEKYSIIHYII
ncbi:MAG: hypothetical protein ACP5QI_03765 [Candidatus Bathyarchaeia archaeon]